MDRKKGKVDMQPDFADPVALQILWRRLVSITDHADRVLGRTAFSQVVRESHDYVTALLDTEGRSIAQCSQSIASFIGSLPLAAKEFLRKYPLESLEPGDVLFTNDAAIGTGHLFDALTLTPVYRGGEVVAFTGNVIHLPDVGGRPLTADAPDIFEEGIRVPILKLCKADSPNQDVLDVIAASVRMPEEVLGDIASGVAANAAMAREVGTLLDEYDLPNLRGIAKEVCFRSREAMKAAIRALPDGQYGAEVSLDGFDEEVRIRNAVEISGDRIHVDYTGTTGQVPYGINVMPHYRRAHALYAVKCLVDPHTPNNEGCFEPITDSAPEGCILNPLPPAACNARNLIGHLIPRGIFRALAELLPQRIPADSGSEPGWLVTCVGAAGGHTRRVNTQFIFGGQGARPGLDGNDTTAFPSNCKSTSAEVFEQVMPVRVLRKELVAGSGGGGQFRGGLGQCWEVENVGTSDILFYLGTGGVRHPAQGLRGGLEGETGAVRLDGEAIFGMGTIVVRPGHRLELQTPGGGGWGLPSDRSKEAERQDLVLGLVEVSG